MSNAMSRYPMSCLHRRLLEATTPAAVLLGWRRAEVHGGVTLARRYSVLHDVVDFASAVHMSRFAMEMWRYGRARGDCGAALFQLSFEASWFPIAYVETPETHHCILSTNYAALVQDFLQRWLSFNTPDVLATFPPSRFFKLEPALSYIIIMFEIIQRRSGLHSDGPSAQMLYSLVAYIFCSSSNEEDEETEPHGAPLLAECSCLSCQEYMVKVVGRSIFDGAVSRSVFDASQLFEPSKAVTNIEGTGADESCFGSGPEVRRDFRGRRPRTHAGRTGRIGRAAPTHRAGDGRQRRERLLRRGEAKSLQGLTQAMASRAKVPPAVGFSGGTRVRGA